MARLTLIQNAQHDAVAIHTITAQPMGVVLTGLAGSNAVFTCTNAFGTIQGAKSVQITYDGAHGGGHEAIEVSSVQP